MHLSRCGLSVKVHNQLSETRSGLVFSVKTRFSLGSRRKLVPWMRRGVIANNISAAVICESCLSLRAAGLFIGKLPSSSACELNQSCRSTWKRDQKLWLRRVRTNKSINTFWNDGKLSYERFHYNKYNFYQVFTPGQSIPEFKPCQRLITNLAFRSVALSCITPGG